MSALPPKADKRDPFDCKEVAASLAFANFDGSANHVSRDRQTKFLRAGIECRKGNLAEQTHPGFGPSGTLGDFLCGPQLPPDREEEIKLLPPSTGPVVAEV
jgi:hypothetical protein